MLNKIEPETLYLQLGQLIATTPDFKSLRGAEAALPNAVVQWLAEAYALVSATGEIVDAERIRHLTTMIHRDMNGTAAQSILNALHRSYAVTKLRVPAGVVSSFVAVGNAHDAFKIIGKSLGEATSNLLLVDPYMDHVVLSDFLPLAKEGVGIRLLSGDKANWLATLAPACGRWVTQYGSSRPLQARYVPAVNLHDRDVLIDGATAYAVSQSFKDIAKRAPATVLQTDPETATMKMASYEALWAQGVAI